MRRTRFGTGDGAPLRTEPVPEHEPRRKKRKKKRSPGPKGRITKRTEDVRSKPGEGRSSSGALSGRAVRHLRALGHHLDPVVQIGKEGVTDGVVAATRAALLAHELVKVRLSQDLDRKAVGAELAERASATLAQTLGRTLLLYKRHPHKPKIELPR